MAEARDVMEQFTEAAVQNKDLEGAAKFFAEDVVVVTPDLGQLTGRERMRDYMQDFFTAFPDFKYETRRKYEDDDTAIDEGRYIGTNTGPLSGPSGSIPATGKVVDMRACEVATVKDGLITHYEFYFDQMEMLTQLGLVPDEAG